MTEPKIPDEAAFLKRAVDGIAERQSDPDKERARAEAYRLRVQALSDYVLAYPISEWPRYTLVLGGAFLTAASTIVVTTSLSTLWDWLAAGGLYAAALILGAASVVILRGNQKIRERKTREARQLFWQWARKVGEPHIAWDPTTHEAYPAFERKT
jgi:hypothetical protein